MEYFAHSGKEHDKSDWQTLQDHLQVVAEIAKHNARYFGADELAYLAGLLHDLGKYTSAFQARLEGSPNKVDHATAGAKVAAEILPEPFYKLISYAIAGHHAGLANGINQGDGRRTLEARLKQTFGKELCQPDNQAWRKELTLPEVSQLLPKIQPHSDQANHGFQFAFVIRMIFSCLVDADFIDTDKFYKQLEAKPWLRGDYPALSDLKRVFDEFLAAKTSTSQLTKVNQLRQSILSAARERAQLPPGLFTLTVPTGGGKTFSSMAFALDHALQHGMRRIIYVIPFTSIIEQNARVFREAFGELGESSVLEHHSNFDDRHIKNENTQDKLKLAMENWDMPIVVTTAVQFFESLFADRPSRCRKLHNISGSVIILDEAQTLPLKFLKPVMAAIDELARNYGCSVVLCTATQPALCEPDFNKGFENVREIAPNPAQLFEELSLVSVSHLGELDDEKLLERIQANEQILTIVNNRRHAQSLFKSLKEKKVEGVFHLTTLMCAAHRVQTLNLIRERLKNNQACRVVSTSLIEAGVDVDFPCVMRAEAGLDSIAQAAGRCNRERLKTKEESHVWVFKSPDWKIPPELEGLSAGMRSVFRRGYDNLLGQEAIKEYFSEVYWRKGDELDQKQLMKMHQDHAPKMTFPFQTIAKEFRMIESFMQPIFVPFDEDAESLLVQLNTTDEVSKLLRKLQPYIVQIPQKGFEALQMAGAIQTVAPHRFEDQFWQLINQDIYDNEFGISWNNPTFIKAESSII
ncbi:CRISPR-associated helicase Cas3' [Thiomicrospira microaerophila]|uniref:CRISPR-associated helicase Cas3' n=1 Tax=Thiomicrospira microaerophila TaxID=406020 RepID=UPI00200C3075|nr:CRISPR-associated helicase Cas3' [Thiomicrospira microaerophila]UQB42566.1 CRISPR-associated helicase Cas3' [Thiomicrospira microaerophila]